MSITLNLGPIRPNGRREVQCPTCQHYFWLKPTELFGFVICPGCLGWMTRSPSE